MHWQKGLISNGRSHPALPIDTLGAAGMAQTAFPTELHWSKIWFDAMHCSCLHWWWYGTKSSIGGGVDQNWRQGRGWLRSVADISSCSELHSIQLYCSVLHSIVQHWTVLHNMILPSRAAISSCSALHYIEYSYWFVVYCIALYDMQAQIGFLLLKTSNIAFHFIVVPKLCCIDLCCIDLCCIELHCIDLYCIECGPVRI